MTITLTPQEVETLVKALQDHIFLTEKPKVAAKGQALINKLRGQV